MRFNPFEWSELDGTEKHQCNKGRLRLRASQAVALYVTAQGYEVLAAVGQEIDLTLSQAVSFRWEGPDNVRVFVHDPQTTLIECEGEVFTNPDRMPSESGAMLEVRRALRMLELQRRSMLEQQRRAANPVQPLLHPVQPDPAPVPPKVEAPAQ